MTSVSVLMNPQLDSVKNAVKSTSTCTAATLESLQLLLQTTASNHETTKAVRKPQNSASNRSSARTKSRITTSTTTANARQLTAVPHDGEVLSTQQKIILATEVFNTASKTLLDVAANRDSTVKAPLQPTSPNRILSSPRKPSDKLSKSQRKTTDSCYDSLHATAECAILALKNLRILKDQDKSKNDTSTLQLEQGACVLAGRLITLGMNDLAYRELSALKIRLQARMIASSSKTSSKSSTREIKIDPRKERVAQLLSFTDMENGQPYLSLLVSFQSQVLKFIATERNISSIEPIWQNLSTIDSSSPACVVIRSAEAGVLSKDKAAVQLLSTSNIILNLSSVLQKAVAANSTSKTLVFSALKLQLLSMEYRIMSWELSGHQGDTKREFLDPIVRYLDSFNASDSKIDPTAFASLKLIMHRLQSNISKSAMKGSKQSWKVNYAMSKIAQEASCLKEALAYLTSAAQMINEDEPMVSSLIQCRIAIAYLLNFKNNKTYHLVVESLTAAALTLKAAIKGTTSDLEALLLESARLKKVAMAKLGELLSSDTNVPKAMVVSAIDFLHSFVRFLRRYISRSPSASAESDFNIQTQALDNARNIIITAVESAIALGKMSLVNQLPIWGDLQPVFLDSAQLLHSFQGADVEEREEDSLDWRTTAVKLSNLFWSCYQKKKDSIIDPEDLISLLEQSIKILQGCAIEQRITGFMAMKLERLAHLYLDSRMGTKSVVCFERSIQEHIDSGTIEQQMAYHAGRAPHVCLQDVNSPGYNLTRVLSSYLKIQLRTTNNTEGTFDSKSLCLESRGFLLEWQMGLLLIVHGHDVTSERLRTIFQALLSELLLLYAPNQYLLNRLRVICLALRFVLDHSQAFESTFTDSLLQYAQSDLSKLHSHAPHGSYAPFISASIKLTLLFCNGDVVEEDFQEIIAFWASTIKDCTDWLSLKSVIDDCDVLLAQAQAASDYAEARGYWKLQSAASEIFLHVLETQEIRDSSSLLTALSRCALQHCRHGDHVAALGFIGRAKQRFNDPDVSNYAAISYQLALAEVNMEIYNMEAAEEALRYAEELHRSEETMTEVRKSRSQSKIAWERLIVDGTLLCSRLAEQKKRLSDALYYGKLAVRLSTRLWTKLERSAERGKESGKSTEGVSDIDLVVDGVANLDLSHTVKPTMWTYTEGAVFWKHITSHDACLSNLMRLSAYNGLFQDSIYYGEQALKVNESLGTSPRLLARQADLGMEWIRGNHLTEARKVLDVANNLFEKSVKSVETVKLKLSLALLSRSQGKHDECLRILRDAESILGEVFDVRLDSSSDTQPPIAVLEKNMAALKIRQASMETEAIKMATRSTRTTRATSKRSAQLASKTSPKLTIKAMRDEAVPTAKVFAHSYLVLRNEIMRQQIHALLAIEDLEGASKLLQIAKDNSTTMQTQVSIQIEETEHLLANAMRSIAAHAVYCVLPESTLSMPSIAAMITGVKTAVSAKKTPVTERGKSTARESRERATKAAKKEIDVSGIMMRARVSIINTVRDAILTGSTVEGHNASNLMGRVSMLSYATTPGLANDEILGPVNANELGRITAYDRERLAISIDKKLSGISDPISWPDQWTCDFSERPDIIDTFTQEYMETLPRGWNVISISLNSQRTEFNISRMSCGSSPFLLRLPLKRSDESGEDEDSFTFDMGKEEMNEIIRLANASAHDAKSRVDRNSKKEWWATRELLDRRLETLLENMENIWLGGFRGIFDAVPRDSTLLARFTDMFDKLLSKHLPSRQKSKENKAHIKVHENVLSLFIGLRDLAKQESPEDSILDLLYFVVDILQFQGERNAYDEIDFDMMVIDTLDMLNSLHSQSPHDGTLDHTILILDKTLHCFPWESLPCLHGLPVSRMPSLECLRERIVRFTSVQSSESPFEVNRHCGQIILNPSGDLKTTQNTFEGTLSHQRGWSAIVGRTPSEEEFKAGLERKDLFLYFGHGSGAQYIRGRTIKRLDKCAVTFLMGCSSGCLTEAGELEPYGTPMNYMQAGSPALVATLWDVTDKDIDRFAKSTFQQWGLLREDEDGLSDKKKGKIAQGRTAKQAAHSGFSRGLDEAVAQSRGSCLLKYLNGAAPVIYGVPVYLSQ